MNKYKYTAKTALLHDGKRYAEGAEIILSEQQAKLIAAYLTLVEVVEPDKPEVLVIESVTPVSDQSQNTEADEPDTAITELGKSETVPDSSEPETVINDAANSEIVNEEVISDPESTPEPDQPQDQDQKAEVVKPKRKATSAK